VLFRGRHFEDQIIVLCVRWYPSYSLSYRDLEQMMAERDLRIAPLAFNNAIPLRPGSDIRDPERFFPRE
jgi:hypothetical protein